MHQVFVRCRQASWRRTLPIALMTILSLTYIPVRFHAEAQQIDAKMCTTVLQQGIHDSYSVLSEKQRFERYQRALCDTRFDSYQAMSGAASSLGLSIPLVEGLMGLNAGSRSSNSQFQNAYSKFCSSQFSQVQNKETYQEHRRNINSEVLLAFNRCVEIHKDAYMKQRGVFVQLTPLNRFAGFLMRVVVMPRGEFSGVRINGIQPDDLVKCTYGGKEVRTGHVIHSVDFVLNCVKPSDRAIPLILETNHGVTDHPISIPAYEPPPPVPTSVSVVARNKTLYANRQEKPCRFLFTSVPFVSPPSRSFVIEHISSRPENADDWGPNLVSPGFAIDQVRALDVRLRGSCFHDIRVGLDNRIQFSATVDLCRTPEIVVLSNGLCIKHRN